MPSSQPTPDSFGTRLARIVAELESAGSPHAEPPAITMAWLRRSRWVAVAGQLSTVLVAWHFLEVPLPLAVLGGVIAFSAGSNALLHFWKPRGDAHFRRLFEAILVLDTTTLTSLLLISGGVGNPFSCFYLVHVAMGAVALGRGAAWRMVGLSTLCLCVLYLVSEHAHWMIFIPHSLHLSGMVVATALAAMATALFAGHLHQALRRRDAELVRLRREAEQRDRFMALATLAAGVAHELGSPLGAIFVAAREMERSAGAHGDPQLLADLVLIRSETERCRELLGRLNARSTAELGEPPVPCDAAALVESARSLLASAHRLRLHVGPLAPLSLLLPRAAVAEALATIIRNACEASTDRVLLAVSTDDERIHFRVSDRGAAPEAAVLTHCGEPFFTTKEPGRGMGLGLYLVRLLAERLQGEFSLTRSGDETLATLTLPRAANLSGDHA